MVNWFKRWLEHRREQKRVSNIVVFAQEYVTNRLYDPNFEFEFWWPEPYVEGYEFVDDNGNHHGFAESVGLEHNIRSRQYYFNDEFVCELTRRDWEAIQSLRDSIYAVRQKREVEELQKKRGERMMEALNNLN